MTALVYLEIRDGVIIDDALGLLAKVAGMADGVTAVICGDGIDHLAAEAGRHGATRVLVVDHPLLADPLHSLRVDVVAELVRRFGFTAVFLPTTGITSDIAAALSVRLDCGLAWGLVDLENRDGAWVGRRPANNDSVVADIAWMTPVAVGLFRPAAFAAADPHPSMTAAIERIDVEFDEGPGRPRLLSKSAFAEGDRAPLSAADIVVSGGRGIGAPQNLALVRDLATLLGGAVGVSLPLVEMGWAQRSMQVGQTGTVVKPRLYIACGISGQIQHRLGMERSGTIVAINTDASAPIMSFCDLAVVADFQRVAPPLIEILKTRCGQNRPSDSNEASNS